jgi:Type IV secretory pathway, protease TraF
VTLPPRRTLLRRAAGAMAVTVLVAGTLGYVQAHWRLAIDRSQYPCLDPHRVFLVTLGQAEPLPGTFVTFATKAVPLFEDGTLFTKQVVAGPGSTVHVGPDGVEVGGQSLPYSEYALDRLAKRAAGAVDLRPREYLIPKGHVFVAGTHPRSYDSRYYGPVPLAGMLGEATPLW